MIVDEVGMKSTSEEVIVGSSVGVGVGVESSLVCGSVSVVVGAAAVVEGAAVLDAAGGGAGRVDVEITVTGGGGEFEEGRAEEVGGGREEVGGAREEEGGGVGVVMLVFVSWRLARLRREVAMGAFSECTASSALRSRL